MPKALPDKTALRRVILAQRRPQSPEAAARLLAKVASLPAFQAARTVFCYCSVAGEADTRRIIETAWAAGKTVCLPRCRGGIMQAVIVRNWDELTPTGFLNILEPPPGGTVIEPGSLDLTLVPGLAFDRDGYRLGYGAGYYDKYLPLVKHTVGLCRAEYLFDKLPRESHDVPVELVLTDD